METIELNGETYIKQAKVIETPVSRTAIIAGENFRPAVNVDDANDVLERFKEVLSRQNIKGHEKYQTSLVDANLSELELVEHLEEEAVDLWQYAQVLRRQIEARNA